MTKNKIIAFLVSGALVAIAGFSLVNYRYVYAQTSNPTPAAPSTPAQPGQPGLGHGKGGMRAGYTEQQLADALGVTLAQLQTAEQSANAEAIQQAVAKGLITQDQANQLSANGNGPRHFEGWGGIDYNALLASALGITTDKLQAAQTQALTTALDAAVAAGNITQAQADLIRAREALASNTNFQTNMKSAYATALKQAVTEGVITQAQADALLQEQSQSGGFFGFGRGLKHGFGGFGRPDAIPGNNGSNSTNPAPTPAPTTGSGL